MTLVSLSPPASEVTRWREVHKSTPALVALADRHYTRQTPGVQVWLRAPHPQRIPAGAVERKASDDE